MEERLRVLAVDDSVTIRKALELILIPAGFAVEFAASGAEALDKARRLVPDVVLLDFILPDMRGSEVCHELRADVRTAHIPVALISARGAEIRQAYEAADNVVRYLTKPFTPDEVIAVVTEVAGSVLPAPQAFAPADEALDSPALDASAETELDVSEPEAIVVAPAAEPPSQLDSAAERPSPCPESFDGSQDQSVDQCVVESTAPPSSHPAGADLAEHAALEPPLPFHRDSLDWVFETLRAGLEGVFVEEMDTPAGAAADEAKSYTELASRLSAQLAEALHQAESGERYALCSDGSIRSLGDTLLDSYRRVCRVLFRAAAAGAVERGEADGAGPRLLVVCHGDSPVAEALDRAVRDAGDWHAFRIASDFRQLPMAARLYGPTHVLIDAARGGAVWQQLRTLRALPEGQRLAIIGVVPAETNGSGAHVDRDLLRELDVAAVVTAGPGLAGMLRAHIQPAPVVAERA